MLYLVDHLYYVRDSIDGIEYEVISWGISKLESEDGEWLSLFLGDRDIVRSIPVINSDKHCESFTDIGSDCKRHTKIHIVDEETYPLVVGLVIPEIRISWNEAMRDGVNGYKVWLSPKG